MAGSSVAERQGAELEELAQLYGIEPAYENVEHQRCEANPDSLLRVLQLLQAPVARLADVPQALRERREVAARTLLEPVLIIWQGEPPSVTLPATASGNLTSVDLRLERESGAVTEWRARLAERSETGWKLALPSDLPLGYHQLRITAGSQTHQSLVIVAPPRSYDPHSDTRTPARQWGVFQPLYAARSSRNWGSGDFTDLEELSGWLHEQGGGIVATLPLLAAFYEEPFEPGPYSPASRLFWNEFYLDVERIPELSRCAAAQTLLHSPSFNTSLAELRAAPLVDYRQGAALKRRVVATLAEDFFANSSPRRDAFDAFLRSRPEVEDYARFRAVVEKRRAPWTQWPDRLQAGKLETSDFDDAAWRYHLYAQWLAEEQMTTLSDSLRSRGMSLYLDLPLGVNGASYDVWREQSAFALGASGGCPPDAVFRNGQDWGFPPLHPQGIRTQGYRYVRNYLRQQMRHAGILRIDHMPVFHRLYWVPDGVSAKEGVYVRYPAEELYAVFSLESHRHQVLLVGEDLGTVPPEVPASMRKHHVFGMYVTQYAVRPDPKQALPAPPPTSFASLNTHDMPPFAAFLDGADIDQREALGLLGDFDPEKEHEKRQATIMALSQFLLAEQSAALPADYATLLKAALRHLAASAARGVLVNLEDLWLETEAQNMPGTSSEHPNWRRKLRFSLADFSRKPEVIALVREVVEGLAPARQTPQRSP